ncbi:general odorant-binding protein 45-like [Uranotaenia lowii]|uniref:general odorant-binding protein 45-like n=1 Tax=Uranotaenia lowii TaxID=190385 RepID=UPI00247A5B63|nr:general odorant-binding protein 45-like [Uranotaenia lowii]
MKSYQVFLILATLIAVSAPLASGVKPNCHCMRYKSGPRVIAECREMLGYPPGDYYGEAGRCQRYCGAMLMRAWDSVEEAPQFATWPRFFKVENLAEGTDCFNDRINSCWSVMKDAAAMDDPCSRVDNAYTCFNHSEVNQREEKYFVPQSQLQHKRNILECKEILQVSPIELNCIQRYGLFEHAKGRCWVRCFMLREQLYDDETGVDIYRTLVQRAGALDNDLFRKNAGDCMERVRESCGLDNCTQAARMAKECFEPGIWSVVDKIVKEL